MKWHHPAEDYLGRLRTAEGVNAELRAWSQARRLRNAVLVARAETAWYVRGGMDPAYATPEARDTQVKWLLRESGTIEAGRMAAAFLRGWVTHRTGPEADLEFYRRRWVAGLPWSDQRLASVTAQDMIP